ncbi:MAG: radical SAM protein [Oligoflexia bacterium]|nr:radical SAM protein [Oligoflexia bacterium]
MSLNSTRTIDILFGPIQSRRLGNSLGIDLIPHKHCTLNCVFCECGNTTALTVEREEFHPYQEVIRAIDHYLSKLPSTTAIDYITFSGAGEPTLYKSLGKVLQYLKQTYAQYKICVLTNGTLFSRSDVRSDLHLADLVIPTFSAAGEAAFQTINRAHPSINVQMFTQGMINFTQEFQGKVWIEIFVIEGVNDSFEEFSQIKKSLQKMRFEKIQMNLLDRPGSEAWVKVPPLEKLQELKQLLSPFAVEIILPRAKQLPLSSTSTSTSTTANNNSSNTDTILAILKRRPSTLEDLCKSLQSTPKVMERELSKIESLLEITQVGAQTFYSLRSR